MACGRWREREKEGEREEGAGREGERKKRREERGREEASGVSGGSRFAAKLMGMWICSRGVILTVSDMHSNIENTMYYVIIIIILL